MYFLLPIFACTFAFPAIFPLTVTLVFFFLLSEIFFLPNVTVHFVFFLLFLSLIFTVFPTYTVTNFFSSLTFFFAAALYLIFRGENILQIVKQIAMLAASILINFLFIYLYLQFQKNKQLPSLLLFLNNFIFLS